MVTKVNSYPIDTILYTIEPDDSLVSLAERFNTDVDTIALVNPNLDIEFLRSGQRINICPQYREYNRMSIGMRSDVSKTEAGLKNYLRMLWEQHGAWTRMTIVSLVFGLPDVDFVVRRLLRNPKDFEVALRPFYGDEKAAKFADLLTAHLTIAADLVKAAKAGDNEAAKNIEEKWYDNAHQIAAFLASINPYWSEDDWRAMLEEHLRMVKQEAVDMITKDYEAGVNQYDDLERQALKMADVMTQGIVEQFSNTFNG